MRFVVAGHSLGGALAQLTAQYLTNHAIESTCVTFGSPKIGDDTSTLNFCSIFAKNYRFTLPFDVVPMLPMIGYEHNEKDVLGRFD